MDAIDRRTFVAGMSAAVFAASRTLSAASIGKIGVQLYTVRDMLAKDFDGTLAKVAAVGYKEVEFAGYFDHTPQQVRDALKKHGLAAPAAHIDYASLGEKFPSVIEAAKTIGHTFLVNPWIDETMRKDPDVYKKMAETYNRAGEMSKKAGIQFVYHNHNFEFVPADGKLPYDFLLSACDPKLVKMELDLCWITSTGKDPVDYFKKYPGRFPLVHVKGLRKVPAAGAAAPIKEVLADVTDVGKDDAIDWKRIFAHSKEAGIQHYFVEHDVPKDPIETLKNSYDYLKKLTF
jgi:sugar phosphate isomerase/epimerase